MDQKMNNKYYVYSDELCHHGILGQKWGVRRYQNEDGSLTKAGKDRYGSDSEKARHNLPRSRQKRITGSAEDKVYRRGKTHLSSFELELGKRQYEQEFNELKDSGASYNEIVDHFNEKFGLDLRQWKTNGEIASAMLKYYSPEIYSENHRPAGGGNSLVGNPLFNQDVEEDREEDQEEEENKSKGSRTDISDVIKSKNQKRLLKEIKETKSSAIKSGKQKVSGKLDAII